ncbi:MAG: hypothetical protein GY720_16705, partial [bacterium]|nr:hypothetical protein [bacterium]
MKHSRIIITSLFALALLAGVAFSAHADGITIRYVDPRGSDTGDCTNFTFPCATIQYAVDQADAGDDIRVAGGTYSQSTSSPVVSIDETITIRGGYTVTNWTVSDPETHVTVLDAEDNGRVVNVTGSITATIEGLRITGGRQYQGRGAGVYVSGGATLGLDNCHVLDNTAPEGYGGGFYVDGTVEMIDTIISGNSARFGGGMQAATGNATLTNVIFSDNSATFSGGGLRNATINSMLTNVTFSGNSATYDGGAIQNFDSNLTLINCIVWGNSSTIYNSGGAPTITYSDVEGGYPGSGNVNVDPLFVDTAGGDLRLQDDSPVIDAGNNLSVTVSTDLDGKPRQIDGDVADTGNGTAPIVDMGAYENQTERSCFVRLNDGAMDYGTVQDAVNASTSTGDVVKVAGHCGTLNAQGGTVQVARITKTLTIRGGYTVTNWTTPDPAANPTVLDARGAGTVLHISGDIAPVIEGLHVTGGASDAFHGAGVHNDGSASTLSNVTISGNVAWDLGGGIYNLDGGDMTLTDVIVHDNAAWPAHPYGFGGG